MVLCKHLFGKFEGKRLLGRCRCRRKSSIKIDLKEIGYDDVKLIQLTQEREPRRDVLKHAVDFRAAQNVGNFLTGGAINSFLRRLYPLRFVNQ
jgi:hypothetical protein